ncbi:hypothetical protein T09_11265 [Trichinella sp. T9]|nr:hypothetical protein T09_11265 [Trichinella sp. T9]
MKLWSRHSNNKKDVQVFKFRLFNFALLMSCFSRLVILAERCTYNSKTNIANNATRCHTNSAPYFPLVIDGEHCRQHSAEYHLCYSKFEEISYICDGDHEIASAYRVNLFVGRPAVKRNTSEW